MVHQLHALKETHVLKLNLYMFQKLCNHSISTKKYFGEEFKF